MNLAGLFHRCISTWEEQGFCTWYPDRLYLLIVVKEVAIDNFTDITPLLEFASFFFYFQSFFGRRIRP